MKNRLFCLTWAGVLGLSLVLIATAASSAQSSSTTFRRLEEDTFIRLPALEFTIATIELEKLVAGVPLNLSRSERAFSQVRPSVNYNGGMFWLTFKYGKHRSFLSQLKNFSIKKRVKSSYRLASVSRYHIEQTSRMRGFSFSQSGQKTPRANPKPEIPRQAFSELPMGEVAPGAFTVDRSGPGR